MTIKNNILLVLFFMSCKTPSPSTSEISEVSYYEFKKLASKCSKAIIDSPKIFSKTTAIEIVKIHNSMRIYNIQNVDSFLYNTFDSLFGNIAFDKVRSDLEMELSVGMSFYSKKYNLSMGASQVMKESYYQIDTATIK